MKKILLVSLLSLATSSVFATTACSGTAGSGTPIANSGTNFVRSGFTPQCSANTQVVFTDDSQGQRLYGGAASSKGKGYYGASTNGGAVKRVADCNGGSCGGTAAASAALGMADAANYGSS